MKLKMTKKKWILLAVVAAIGVVVGRGYIQAANFKPTVTGATLERGELQAYFSTSGKVTKGDLDEYILSGNTEVKDVYFKIGDTVKAGDLIVAFDNQSALDDYKQAAIGYETARLQLDDTERTYFKAKEDLEEARKDVDWYKSRMDDYENPQSTEDLATFSRYEASWEAAKNAVKTMEKSIMSDEQIKIAQLNFEKAKMTMDAAQKAVDELPQNIVAKSEGVIESLTAVKFNRAAKGQVAATVRTSGATTVDLSVGRYDLSKIAVGQSAIVTVSGKEYKGTVSHIDPVAGADSFVKATVTLENPEGLIPGVDADLEILSYSASDVLLIPIEAVKTDRQGDYCYILTPAEGGKEGDAPLFTPAKTYIKTGNSSDTSIEVLEGLEAGTHVAVNPPQHIDVIPLCYVTGITPAAGSGSEEGTSVASLPFTHFVY